MSDRQPWYATGLRFSCIGCGNCCCGEPGAVWVNDDEIARLAAHLEIEAGSFEHLYVRKYGVRRALFERFNGDCVFFDPESRGCRVYAARPTQCRSWPFWRVNVASAADWSNTYAECPGCGTGELHTVSEITQAVCDTEEAHRRSGRSEATDDDDPR